MKELALAIAISSLFIFLLSTNLLQSYAVKIEEESNAVNVGDRVGIKYHVTSNLARENSFATFIQIKDSNGVVVQLSWLTGVLKPEQNLDIVQTWMPLEQGKYTAEIFVWECLTECSALSPVRTMEITVV